MFRFASKGFVISKLMETMLVVSVSSVTKTSMWVRRLGKFLPIRLATIFMPSRACDNDRKGVLPESPWIDNSISSPVVKNLVRKLWRDTVISILNPGVPRVNIYLSNGVIRILWFIMELRWNIVFTRDKVEGLQPPYSVRPRRYCDANSR